MAFYKNLENYRRAIPKRASEMKKAAEAKWGRENRRLSVVGPGYIPNVADWGCCMCESWAEFRDPGQWITSAGAQEITGYSPRELLRLRNSGRIVAVLGKDGKWYYNRHSVTLFVGGLPALDPSKQYQTVEEYAAAYGCGVRNIQIKIKRGQLPAIKIKKNLYIEVGNKSNVGVV